jgi:hypothetical protein
MGVLNGLVNGRQLVLEPLVLAVSDVQGRRLLVQELLQLPLASSFGFEALLKQSLLLLQLFNVVSFLSNLAAQVGDADPRIVYLVLSLEKL